MITEGIISHSLGFKHAIDLAAWSTLLSGRKKKLWRMSDIITMNLSLMENFICYLWWHLIRKFVNLNCNSLNISMVYRDRIILRSSYYCKRSLSIFHVCKNVSSCLFSVPNIISLLCHVQVRLIRLRFERYFSHHWTT